MFRTSVLVGVAVVASVTAAASCTLDTEGSAATGDVPDGSAGAGFGAFGGVGGLSGAGGVSDASEAGGSGGSGGAIPIPDGGCFPGTKPCNGVCVPLADPAYGCGPTTCEPCALTNATARCEAQQCRVELCASPHEDCNQDPLDGCESNLQLDPTHCGTCTTDCIAQFGPSQECSAGQCRVSSCPGTTRDCNLIPADLCEIDTATDVANCGFCSNACNLAHSVERCVAGQCDIASCSGDWGNCDGNVGNGCETDTDRDVAHCGMCGRACNATGGTATCSNGNCGIVCLSSRGNCDGNVGNGCETNTTNTTAHCGGCGQACSTNGAVPTCSNSSCTLACVATRGNCDGNVGNGCETSFVTNPAHCGGCNRPCSTVGGTSTCVQQVCVMACNPGRGDCDANVGNGCETDTTASTAHCGACSQPCSTAGGTPTCVAGACQIACSPGRGNCDGDAGNGCEVDTATSMPHCGGCNQPCVAPQTCTGGVCM